MSRKTFKIFLNSYLENFANISNFLFANFADLLDFLQLCHLLNFVCQPCRSFRCGRRYPASRSVSRPSSWGSGCALWECENTRMWWWRGGGGGREAMMLIMRASVRSWCVLKNAIMMITMMIDQTSLSSLHFVLNPQPLVVPLLTQGYREIVLLTREIMKKIDKLINW